MQIIQSRRHFLAGVTAAGAAGLVGSSDAGSPRAATGNDHGPPSR